MRFSRRLAVLAVGGTIASPDASATGWITRLDGAELVALVVGAVAALLLAVGGIAFVSLMRSYGRVLVRLERVETALVEAGIELEDEADMPHFGLEPGSPAPAFSALTLAGEIASLETLTASGKPSILLFTNTHCPPCRTLLPTVASWQRDLRDSLNVVLAMDGSVDEIRAETLELENVLLDENRELYDAFRANGTPGAVLVAPDGTVASWVVSGVDWIEQLVGQLVHGRTEDEEAGIPVGADVPALELPSLSGEPIGLDSLRGRESVLLFWNPDCGFCRGMHDDLLAWEATANGVTPRLVVVSSGDEARTEQEGFSSLVLLDRDFAAGTAFNAHGTPMAVLVDAEGRIGSRVVAGADAVLDLVGAHDRQ